MGKLILDYIEDRKNQILNAFFFVKDDLFEHRSNFATNKGKKILPQFFSGKNIKHNFYI